MGRNLARLYVVPEEIRDLIKDFLNEKGVKRSAFAETTQLRRRASDLLSGGNVTRDNLRKLHSWARRQRSNSDKTLINIGFNDFLEQCRLAAATGPNLPAPLAPGTNRLGLDAIIENYIDEHTDGFVGRAHVFRAIDGFLKSEDSGYFLIRGDAGAGKTSIVAKYSQDHDCPRFFNIRRQGFNRSDQFLASVCTQLLQRTHRKSESLPSDATKNGMFLVKLLHETVGILQGAKLVLVIDALDEVDPTSQSPNANVLYLPETLPKNVYFILTSRRRPEGSLRLLTDRRPFDLRDYPEANSADIRLFLSHVAERHTIGRWLERHKQSAGGFIDTLAEKSDGNFMYLYHVVRDIEKGRYDDGNIKRLPHGLEAYYEDHWRVMGMTAKPLPRTKIDILYALCEGRLEFRLIVDAVGTTALKVQEVLNDWSEFLHCDEDDDERWISLYHESFRDFLKRTDTMKAAKVDMERLSNRTGDALSLGLEEWKNAGLRGENEER